MYYPNGDREIHPENYYLADISINLAEDECHDILNKPRQTQTTIGMYLRKKKGIQDENDPSASAADEPIRISPSPNQKDRNLEKLLDENKPFWVDKPSVTAPLIFKLKELYTVDIPKKDLKRGQGVFFRPDYLDMDYLIKLGQAGLLYPDEEITDSEEEIKPDDTMCLPLRKKKYKLCDPCKPKPEKKKMDEVKTDSGMALPFKKIITGCQCDFYPNHRNLPARNDPCPTADSIQNNEDKIEMIRRHEMDKCFRPFKSELLNRNYDENPPVRYLHGIKKSKRTFPFSFM